MVAVIVDLSKMFLVPNIWRIFEGWFI